MMTPEQITEVVQTVSVLWPAADVNDRLVAGYSVMLGHADLDPTDVRAALVHLAVDERREWPPPPGIVVAAARDERRNRVDAAFASIAVADERRAYPELDDLDDAAFVRALGR